MLSRVKGWLRTGHNWLTVTVAIIGALLVLIGFFEKILGWGALSWAEDAGNLFWSLLPTYWVALLLVAFAICISWLYIKLDRLQEDVAPSFKDSFTKSLDRNWEYNGKWQLSPGGGLSVTESDFGGITRVGQLWRDYSFEFTAVIVHDRIGWILRAQDLFNYYMIQLTPTLVRPHLRIEGKWILLGEFKHERSIKPNQPIKIRTELRGTEARIYANDEEIYSDRELFSMKFLQVTNQQLQVQQLQPNVVIVPSFTTGRVGFRMDGQESGRISHCRVRRL